MCQLVRRVLGNTVGLTTGRALKAQRIRPRGIEQDAISERLRVVHALGQGCHHTHRLTVKPQQRFSADTAEVHAALIAVHVVDVQFIELQRSLIPTRIKTTYRVCRSIRHQLQTPVEFFGSEIQPYHAVITCRRNEQMVLMHTHLMAVLQVGVAVRGNLLKPLVEHKYFVTGGNVDVVVEEGDTAQPAIPAASLPIDVHLVPIDRLQKFCGFCVQQVYAAMALALVTAAHHGTGNQLCHDALGPMPVTDREYNRR